MVHKDKYIIQEVPPCQNQEILSEDPSPTVRATVWRTNRTFLIILAGIALGFLFVTFICWFAYFPLRAFYLVPVGWERYPKLNRSEGRLVLYPLRSHPGPNYELNLGDDAFDTTELSDLLEEYPKELNASLYADCLNEAPTLEKPCFFNRSWIERCNEANFGYTIEENSINPCIALKIANASDWKPKIFNETSGDASFDIGCYPQTNRQRSKYNQISYYPKEGFSTKFFPASGAPHYLAPSVIMVVENLAANSTITLNCWLYVKNAYKLTHEGRFTLKIKHAGRNLLGNAQT